MNSIIVLILAAIVISIVAAISIILISRKLIKRLMIKRIMKKYQPVERLSNCCAAKPLGETYTDEDGVTSGTCSRCKDGAVFMTFEQIEAEDAEICGECEQQRPGDDRVAAGMKCGPCSY